MGHGMPNGSDKNWVRLCLTIDGFRARFDVWPTRLRAKPDIVEDIREHLLTQESWGLLAKKIQLLSDPGVESLIAEDDAGRECAYGSDYSTQSLGVRAAEWPSITPIVEDELSNYSVAIGNGRAKDPETTKPNDPPSTTHPAIGFIAIDYKLLNARQKENFNFQKLSAVLADFGFTTMRLNDDWRGADFIAQHLDGQTFLGVQLKGRLVVATKYERKELYVAFFESPYWYMYPHDELLDVLKGSDKKNMFETVSWRKRGGYSFPRLDKKLFELLEPYRIPHSQADRRSRPTDRRSGADIADVSKRRKHPLGPEM